MTDKPPFEAPSTVPPTAGAPQLEKVASTLTLAAGVAILVLMFATALDVLLRKFFQATVPGVVEWTEVFLVIVVFAGMMGAEMREAHIRGVSFLTENPRSLAALLLRAFGSWVGAALLCWAVVTTLNVALESVALREFRMGIVQVPIWPAKLVIPVGLAGFAAVLAYRAAIQSRNFYRELLRRRGNSRTGRS